MPDAPPPAIWRLPGLSASADESLRAADACTDEALRAVVDGGFTGIWFFCNLYELMDSTVYPELNQPLAAARIGSLQTAINRAAAHGLDVWLYFNEPAGVPKDHPFWQTHADVMGVDKWNLHGLCTSTPEVMAFFRQAVDSVFQRLHGAAGVILITACENLTHCWSKINRQRGGDPPTCPRCRDREPADLVHDILLVWNDIRRTHDIRVIAWNWEWAYWYDDPPAPIIDRLPAGMELLLDLEIGGEKRVGDRTVPVTEYALSYVGPGRRMTLATERARRRQIPVHAKVQWNSTHELCSVPNLPVLATLHAKLVALQKIGIEGYMGCWTIGCEPTLNTLAVNHFRRDPERYGDADRFLADVAAVAFPGADSAALTRAWRGFSAAFIEQPYTIPWLYNGPHNDAPARAMSLDFAGQPTGRSWMPDPPGDDFGKCLGIFMVDELIAAYDRMIAGWTVALTDYDAALADATAPMAQRELGVARMIAIQLRSTARHLRFYRERLRLMAELGLAAPCTVPLSPTLRDLMVAERDDIRDALPLLAADPRLGFHEECQTYKYDADMIRAKIADLTHTLNA